MIRRIVLWVIPLIGSVIVNTVMPTLFLTITFPSESTVAKDVSDIDHTRLSPDAPSSMRMLNCRVLFRDAVTVEETDAFPSAILR